MFNSQAEPLGGISININRVENGFIAKADDVQRVYETLDALVADMKTYFGV